MPEYYIHTVCCLGGMAIQSGKSYFPNTPEEVHISCGRLRLSEAESVCPIVGMLLMNAQHESL